jgi:hypothetical protein
MALRPHLSMGLLLSDVVEHSIAEGYRLLLFISVIWNYRIEMPQAQTRAGRSHPATNYVEPVWMSSVRFHLCYTTTQ